MTDQGGAFVLTVVADFGATAGTSTGSLRLEAGQFQTLFDRLKPRIELTTTDHLTGAPRAIRWELPLASMRAFDPESILAQFPVSAPLLACRRRIVEVARSSAGLPGLLDALDGLWPDVPGVPARSAPSPAESWPGPRDARPAGGGGGLDALLDLVDVPGAVAPGAAGTSGSAAPEGVRDRLHRLFRIPSVPWEARLKQALAAIDEALGRQLEAILHDPACRDREAAWRGLWAIAEAADLRRGDLRLLVRHADRAGAPEALAELRRELAEGWTEKPAAGAILVDHPIGDGPASWPLLAAGVRLAQAGSAHVLMPVDPGLLGRGARPEQARPGAVSDLVGTEALAACRAAVAESGFRVVVTCNRFLFRPPHLGGETTDVPGAYRENVGGADGPYGNAVWIAGRALAEAVRRGAPDAALSLRAARVGGLAMRPLGRPDDPERLLPLEFMPSVTEARDLLDAGLTPLTCEPDSDTATLSGLGAPGPGGTRAGAATRDATAGGADAGDSAESPGTGISSRFHVHLPPPRTEEGTPE
jgi:hypothetical protein